MHLAATLLLEFRGDSHAAFTALANMLQSSFFFDFYRLDARDVEGHIAVFDACLKARVPRGAARGRFHCHLPTRSL